MVQPKKRFFTIVKMDDGLLVWSLKWKIQADVIKQIDPIIEALITKRF